MNKHLDKANSFCKYIKKMIGVDINVCTYMESIKKYRATDSFFLIDLGERANIFSSNKFRKLLEFSNKYRKFEVVEHGVDRLAIINYKESEEN